MIGYLQDPIIERKWTTLISALIMATKYHQWFIVKKNPNNIFTDYNFNGKPKANKGEEGGSQIKKNWTNLIYG